MPRRITSILFNEFTLHIRCHVLIYLMKIISSLMWWRSLVQFIIIFKKKITEIFRKFLQGFSQKIPVILFKLSTIPRILSGIPVKFFFSFFLKNKYLPS